MPTRTLQSLIIIGNGMATGRLLDDLKKYAAEAYRITVIGDEPFGSYNRIMLSSVLAGKANIDDIMNKPTSWYEQNNVTLYHSVHVDLIDKTSKVIHLDNGLQLHYDHLVIATGSRCASIPAKNQTLKGIFSFRNIKDTQNIENWCIGKKHALVVGGGLLGLEAAYGLSKKGMNVSLVHRNTWLMNRQMDETSGKMLKASLESRNIHFHMACEVTGFNQRANQKQCLNVSAASLNNGIELDIDLVIIATGITPNCELGETGHLNVNRAIVVDDFMLTSDPHISAFGECCEHQGHTFGLVDPIWIQSNIVAKRLGGLLDKKTNEGFKNISTPTKLKVSGIHIFSAGIVHERDGYISSYLIDERMAIYRRLFFCNGLLVGIILFGDVSSGMYYFNLMQNQQLIKQEHIHTLLLGEDFYSKQLSLDTSLMAANSLLKSSHPERESN